MNNKTEAEQLREEWEQWDREPCEGLPSYPDNYAEKVADWWLNKMSEQKAKMVEEIEKEIKDNILQIKYQGDIDTEKTKWANYGFKEASKVILEIINKQ